MTKWQSLAVCAGATPELFEQEATKEVRDFAKDAYCARCPVIDQCYNTAMVDELEGVWGGTDDWERARQRTEWKANNPEPTLSDLHQKSMDQKNAQQSVDVRYARRLEAVRQAYEAFLNDPMAVDEMPYYDANLIVLESMIGNPTKNYQQLGARVDKSASWFKKRFREVCDRYSIQVSQ